MTNHSRKQIRLTNQKHIPLTYQNKENQQTEEILENIEISEKEEIPEKAAILVEILRADIQDVVTIVMIEIEEGQKKGQGQMIDRGKKKETEVPTGEERSVY